MHLRGLQDRYPDQLSGGQRQRVSLAQALSRNPRVVLLDEPFSALDAPVRAELRAEVRRLQYETGLSTVLVTHDPEEAALLADEIVVVADGRLLQAGTRDEVYSHPGSPRVAQLLGMQNLIPAQAGAEDELLMGTLTVISAPHRLPAGANVVWGIRPEHVEVSSSGQYPAQVIDVANLGAMTAVRVRLEEAVEVHIRAPATRSPGDRGFVSNRPRSVRHHRVAGHRPWGPLPLPLATGTRNRRQLSDPPPEAAYHLSVAYPDSGRGDGCGANITKSRVLEETPVADDADSATADNSPRADAEAIRAAIEKIAKSIAGVTYENGPQRALAARALADLAEARAWLVNPGQPHGGRVTASD